MSFVPKPQRNIGLRDAIIKAGLFPGLVLCLDAGSHTSYAGGTSFLDTSGNGYDFFLGPDATSTSTDPTFDTAGTFGMKSLNEHFNFDGTQYLTYDTTNEAWMNRLHQDSAKFTLFAWFYTTNGASGSQIFGTSGSASANTGLVMFRTGGGVNGWRLQVLNAGVSVLNTGATFTIQPNVWSCAGFTIDEATGAGAGGAMYNGRSSTFNATYSSPAAGNATYTAQIGAMGNNASPAASGDQIAALAMWEGTNLSNGQMIELYRLTRPRFMSAGFGI